MKRVKFGFESMFLVYDFKILPKRDIKKPHFYDTKLNIHQNWSYKYVIKYT